jgi:hypothetical protein
MIYTAPCIMFWMRAYPLRGEVGGGWALELPSFLGPVKWERANMRVPFGAQKNRSPVFKYKGGFGVYSINKTGGRRKMCITRVNLAS